jgi:hypothetical protein
MSLMLQKNTALLPANVEAVLESSAIPMGTGCAAVLEPGTKVEQCWNSDAIGHDFTTANAALAATP